MRSQKRSGQQAKDNPLFKNLSRIYGGIHFRFSCEDGMRLGRRVGDYIWEKNKGLRTGTP